MNAHALTRKIGPLPAYVWVGIVVGAILIATRIRAHHAQAVADSQVEDPSQDTGTSNSGTNEYANTGSNSTGSGSDGPFGYGSPFESLLQDENEQTAILSTIATNTAPHPRDPSLPANTVPKPAASAPAPAHHGAPAHKKPTKHVATGTHHPKPKKPPVHHKPRHR